MTLITQRVTPFLWYPSEAEKAAETYVKIFGGSSRIVSTTPMSVEFELEGQRLVGFNGGPYKEFNEAISLSVSCADQAEVDYFWEKLVEGGTPSRCGWLKDRWGLSWQVVPKGLPGLLFGSDPAGAQRAMQAMMPMAKLDIGVLERAYRGEGRGGCRAPSGAGSLSKAGVAAVCAAPKGWGWSPRDRSCWIRTRVKEGSGATGTLSHGLGVRGG